MYKILIFCAEFVFCTLLIETCGLEMQACVKIALYILSAFACCNLQTKINDIKGISRKRWHKIAFIFLDVYGAFALAGNRLFIYPLNKQIKIQDIACFIIVCIWFFPILVTILYVYSRLQKKCCLKKDRQNHLVFAALVTLLLILPACIALYAFNPAISSWDSAHCLFYAHNIKGMQDWHPPIYVCFLRAILNIWDATYAVIFVQILFWAAVMLEGILYLRRKGWKDWVLVVLALMSACNSANYLQICTIWKDVPYAFAILWLTMIIARLVTEENARKGMLIYLELIISLFLVCMMRQNGIVPYILSSVGFVIFFHKNRRLLVSVIVSLTLVISVKGPLYHYLDIQPMQKGNQYIGLGQDIIGVYYAGGDLSQDTIHMVMSMTEENIPDYSYNPYYASSYPVDISVMEFIKNYIDTLIRNPIVMLRAVICRQDTMLDILDGQDSYLGCVNYTETVDNESVEWREFWETYYSSRKENALTIKMKNLSTYTAQNQLLRAIEWRSGLSVLLLLVSLFYLGIICRKKQFFFLYVPIAGHILSLFLSSGWNDYRYYWPINLTALFICFFTLVIKEEEMQSVSDPSEQVR